jgi:hypothetical protein
MDTDQKIWDACLIKTWRNAGNVLDAIQMYQSITHKELDFSLLRVPKLGYPWKTGIRVFVAAHLHKISKRLWEQSAEKDIELLRKLQTSSYTTSLDDVSKDQSLANEANQHRRNRKKVGMSNLAYQNRNHDTNWNVVK